MSALSRRMLLRFAATAAACLVRPGFALESKVPRLIGEARGLSSIGQRIAYISHAFLGAPYIATLLVAEEHRNRGVGSQLLRHAEHVFSGQRQIFLCVSAANERARALYLRHGFEQVAILPDLVVEGRDELLLRKRLPSPLQG